ncbi:MAG: hypothetical protein JWP50_2953 [Phenylobacterium sp.]|nr:hypothetical protein [Phenylobacterium sp.]
MTTVQAIPIDQRLNLLAILAHAKPVVQVFLFLLIVLLIASVVVWIGQLAQGKRAAVGDDMLSAVLISAPLFGLTAAAYNLLDMSIGIANVRPTPDMTILAPGFAEASLCILLGLLAASLAAAFRAHLRLSGSRGGAA